MPKSVTGAAHVRDNLAFAGSSAPDPVTITTGVVTILYPTREDVLRLEAKLDALILALKAGAIGRWQ